VVNGCFEAGRQHRPDLAGRAVVEVRLVAGQPTRVLLRESTLNFARVDNCIVEALGKLAYPELKAGGPVSFRRLFAFPPDRAAEAVRR
jgi:hypothetical protein